MPLPDLLRALFGMGRRLALLACTLWLLAVVLVLAMPRSYVARAVVAPAETTAFAVSSLLSPSPFAPGGLLDTRPTGNFAVYLGALRAPEAAAMLAATTRLPQSLAEARSGSPIGLMRAAIGLDRPVDGDDLLDWLTRHLAVTQSLASVTWTIELAHADRLLALEMLQRLHAFAEAKVRADLADQAGRRVTALEHRLDRESDVFLRNSLYELLAQQQRAGLIVAADEVVAARLVSAPAVEIRPSLPNRPLLIGLLAIAVPMAVVLAAAALVLLRSPGGQPPAAMAGAGVLRRRVEEPVLAMMGTGPAPTRPPPVVPPPGAAPR